MITVEKYTRTAMVLHWVVAVLIVGNAALGIVSDDLPDAWIRPAVDTHKSIGITVLGLAILRLLWRVAHRPPPLPAAYPAWERVCAHAAHVLLYGLIFGLPLSGWLHDSAWTGASTHPMVLFGLVPWPRLWFLQALDAGAKDYWHAALFTVHKGLAFALYGLLTLHVLGALNISSSTASPSCSESCRNLDPMGAKAFSEPVVNRNRTPCRPVPVGRPVPTRTTTRMIP